MPLEHRLPYDYVLPGSDNTYRVLLPSYLNPSNLIIGPHIAYLCPETGRIWARARSALLIACHWTARYAYCPQIYPTSLFTPVERRVPGFLESLPTEILRHEFLALYQELSLND